MTYKERYERLSAPFAAYACQLNLLNRCLTAFMYVLYPALLLYLGLTRGWLSLLPYLFIPGIGFILVSLGRAKINWPRPYEDWDINPLIVKKTRGNTMPSRHVFSASSISMAVLHVNLWLGLACFFVTLLIAVLRVIAGVHYPRDVVAGCVIGIVCGLFLWL